VDAALGSILYTYNGPSGLGAEAEFTFLNPTTLQVRLKNTSTGVPVGFESSDQLLTSVSWTFKGGVSILAGSVFTGPTSQSVNFSILNVGSNADVSGEWGYGNGGTTGLGLNYISSNSAGTTPFGGANLDSTVNIDGPQAGLVANPALVPLGGLGAIENEIIATLTLSGAYSEAMLAADIAINGTNVEFGSDAAFVAFPSPAGLALLGVAGILAGRRRRR
jgi:MYXO-CTERM domain-containing protein